jgi:hypothetical protein
MGHAANLGKIEIYIQNFSQKISSEGHLGIKERII